MEGRDAADGVDREIAAVGRGTTADAVAAANAMADAAAQAGTRVGRPRRRNRYRVWEHNRWIAKNRTHQ